MDLVCLPERDLAATVVAIVAATEEVSEAVALEAVASAEEGSKCTMICKRKKEWTTEKVRSFVFLVAVRYRNTYYPKSNEPICSYFTLKATSERMSVTLEPI